MREGMINISGVNIAKPETTTQTAVLILVVICSIAANAVIIGSITNNISQMDSLSNVPTQGVEPWTSLCSASLLVTRPLLLASPTFEPLRGKSGERLPGAARVKGPKVCSLLRLRADGPRLARLPRAAAQLQGVLHVRLSRTRTLVYRAP